MNFKISGRGGEEMFRIPAPYVKGFLKIVLEHRNNR